MQTPNSWKRRAVAAEKTVEYLKHKVVSLYEVGSQSVISKQLERAKARQQASQRRREVMEARQQEMAHYTSVLEDQVEERTRAIRTILDNVTFGFLLVDRRLRVLPGYTASCVGLFGSDVEDGARLCDLLQATEREATILRTLVEQVFEDLLPEEVSLSQLPTRFALGQKFLRLQAKVVRNGGDVESLLISISDITALENAAAEARRNGAIISILSKRTAFARFVEDTRHTLDEAILEADQSVVRRQIHTVKGNAASWGLVEVVELIHRIEDQDEISVADVELVHAEVASFLDETYDALGLTYREDSEARRTSERTKVEELREILRAIGDEEHSEALRRWAESTTQCPAGEMIGPLDVFVGRIAERSGKNVDLDVHGAETLVDPDTVAPVFRNLTHLLRNAVDHGIEAPNERGCKPDRGVIEVRITSSEEHFEVTVSDDGRGVDVNRLGNRAVEQGRVTQAELETMGRQGKLDLIFQDGLSSASEVTEISGRGVGMAAVRGAARSRGGTVDVASTPGQGTRITVRVPKPNKVRKSRQQPDEEAPR